MRYSSRLFLYAPVALLAALAIGVCLNWYIVSGSLAAKLDELNGREAMPGLTLRYSKPRIGGFPFRVDAVFEDFRATVDDRNGPFEWRAENVALHRLTYGSQTLFEAAGKQSLRWTDDRAGTRELVFTPGRMQASSIMDKAGLARFDLDIVGIGGEALKGARFQFHIRRDSKAPLLNIVVKSDRVGPSSALQSLLGESLSSNFKGDVTKAESFDGLRAGTMSWIEAQERWRANKGEVKRTD